MREFDKLVKVVNRLRKECPWDREQTHQSLKPFMIEELHESFEAIDHRDPDKLAEELGDQLLHILMHAAISKKFSIKDIIRHITQKMIRRHPHVFSKVKVKNKEEVLSNWESIKEAEDKISQSGVKLSKLHIKKFNKIWRKKK